MEVKLSKDLSCLTKPAEPWPLFDPPFDRVELAEAMTAFVLKQGMGVAYNQLDLPGSYSVFAMRGEPENFVCFNPRIVQPSEEAIALDEGCLSFPNLICEVERPRHVRVRFQAPDGETYTKTFSNMTARVFQHEYEHTIGKLFFENVSRLKLERAIKKAKKLGNDYSGMGLLKYCS